MIYLNSVFGFNNPKLPQDDWLGEKLRKAQLAISKNSYRWTTQSPNLPGVPLLKTDIPLVVPYASRPTLVWIFEVTEVVLKIGLNLIDVLLHEADEETKKVVEDLVQQVEGLQKNYTAAKVILGKDGNESFSEKLIETLKLSGGLVKESFDSVAEVMDSASKEVKDFASNLMDSPEKEESPANPNQEAISDVGKGLIAQFSQLNRTILGLQDKVSKQAFDKVTDFYNDLFRTIDVPEIATEFQTEASFAQYRTQGPNPMLIELVTELKPNYSISSEGYQKVMGDKDSLELALKEKRLFVCDYCELLPISENPSKMYQPRFVPAPVAYFARAKDGKSLVPVAIQPKQQSNADEVVYAEENQRAKGYWPWMQARTLVQNADGNYHELFVHLARTHLVIEAIAVATHRNLSRRHPLWVLLIPHMEGTLFINEAAAVQLIAEDGPINMVFGGNIKTTQETAGKDRLNYDFYQNMLKTDLKRRGVDDKDVLPDYPYRDDATLVWDAIAVWATDYVDTYYKSDGAVTGDTELKAWVDDIIHNGQVAGFRDITSKSQLSEVLTMIIFTASAQHAAVNFPQRTLMSYPPALSAAVYGEEPFPATEKGWGDMLPPFVPSIVQLSTLYLLGSVYYRKLGEYRSNTFPYLPWFGDNKITKPGGPLDKFNKELQRIEEYIKGQNLLRPTPYPYLLPSQIPPSINI